MQQNVLKVENLDVRYGQVQALRGVGLSVDQGECVVVVGTNGAGKTTLMKSIVGLLQPAGGVIYFFGKRISGQRVHSVVRNGISLIPEGRMVFGDQTVLENLFLGAYWRQRSMKRSEIEKVVEACFSRFPILRERRHQLASTLSGGEQQMLVISRGLMSQPSLLLIDEPSLGLAPLIIEEVFRTIHQLNREGMTILLVEQMAVLALRISNRGYVLEHGAVVLEDGAEALIRNRDIAASYLGKERSEA
jgi:branched-chain amino acid transport system ATP-binding protein